MVANVLAAYGDKPALVMGGRTISYGELAKRVANAAAEFGAGKQLIAVEGASSEQAIVSYLAARLYGHAVALLPVGDVEAREDFEARFSPDHVCRMIDGRWRRSRGHGTGGPIHPDLSLLLATSGSTGTARYVRLSNSNVDANASSIANYLGLAPHDRTALILPLHYSYGLSVLNSHLAVGASVSISGLGILDAGFLDSVAGCTNISGVPYSFELFEQIGLRDRALPSLRFMTCAGGRMSAALVELYRRHMEDRGGELFLMYGQTEAAPRIAFVPPNLLPQEPGTIGQAVPGGTLRLVDASGRSIEGTGTPGELVYSGPNVMMGYAESRSDLATPAELTELRTGDMAVRAENGLFRIVGRLKRISKIGGRRISHEAIEFALEQKGIAAAVSGDDQKLVAAYTSDLHPDKVRSVMGAAASVGGSYVDAVRVDRLPRLATGKIDYQAILAMSRGHGEARATLHQEFEIAFFPKRVTLHDTFNSLGGDSLAYVQLTHAIERKLGIVPLGWETMTIAKLGSMVPTRSAWRSIETEAVFRAMSILLIVVAHATLWPIPGGAAVLMLLVGFNLARFSSNELMAGNVVRPLKSLAANLALYAPIVIGFTIARGSIPWPSVFLVGNTGFFDPATMLPYLYWFVEAYAQVVLIFCGLFMIAPVRRWATGSPFLFGAALFAAGVLAKFAVPLAWNVGAVQIFTVPDVFYVAAIGWWLPFAGTRRQKIAVLTVVLLLSPLLAWTGGNWTGSWVKFTIISVVTAALLFRPRILFPRALASIVFSVAAASYYIYLFHRIIPEWLGLEARFAAPAGWMLSIAVGLASGISIWHAHRALKRLSLLKRLGPNPSNTPAPAQ